MILVVDNYDSFTFNLVQALRALGAEVVVRRNDAIDADGVAALAPRALLLSPGPGRPEESGALMAILARHAGRLPTLGVCLGHQAIGLLLGARLDRAPVPVHGKPSPIEHDGRGLFAGLPTPLTVGRYHSLALAEASLPAALRVTARTRDGVVMAIEHTGWPLWGLQFHPESVLTPEGPRLLARFLELARVPPATPAGVPPLQ